MQRSSWVNTFGWALIGGILAPAALGSVLMNRAARRRVVRLLLAVRDGTAEIRDDVFGDFTFEEFVTGTLVRRSRR
jgi:hypothetical protein